VKKYGSNGTRLKEMEQARARLALPKVVPAAGEPVFVPAPKAEPAAATEAGAVAAAPAAEAEAAPSPVAEVEAAPAAEAAGETAAE
jgi:2-oxoglutarate dehydrogenase E2 component (dihydrolipoamide succinyltransferase)